MLSLGEVLKRRYRVDRMLDIGALEGHYGGWDLQMNEPVLIKELLPQPDLEPEALEALRESFERDAGALTRLDHPHIARVIDHFCMSVPENTAAANAYLIQQVVAGQTLAEMIKREGAIREAHVSAWAQQLLDALAHAHHLGVCHRDIKPENILITPDNRAVLINFEIVAFWNPLDPRMWTAKRVMGTPQYAPPECWGMKMTHVDTRSDIYSLGATLYHAITGEQPLTAGERTSNPYRFLQVKALNPKVSPATRDAVLRAMELPRDKRFQSAAAMRKAFEQKTDHDSSASPPPAAIWPARATPPWTRQRKLNPRLLLGGMVAVVLVALAGVWFNSAGFKLNPGALGDLIAREPETAEPVATATPDIAAGFVEIPLLTRAVAPGADATLQAGAPITATPPADIQTAATPSVRPSPTLASLGLSLAPPNGWTNVVEETFADNRHGWLISEHEDDWGSTSRQIEDGIYRWTINAAQAVGRWCTPELRDDAGNVTDFHAGVDAQRVSGPEAAAYGMILRQVEGSYYVFNVRDDGYFQFSLWYGYEWRPIVDWTQTTAVRSGGVNRLTVRAEGERFELFINDERVAEAENDTIEQGDVGLSISTAATEGDAVFVFDNFTLWTP